MRTLLSLALFVAAVPVAAQPSLPQDLSDGWSAYEKRFEHAAGTYTSTGIVRDGKKTSTQTASVSFAFTPVARRAELKVTEPTWKEPIWRVTGANSKYVFRLERGGAGWVLRKVVMRPDTPAAKPYEDELTTLLAPVRSLVAVGDTRLNDLAGNLVTEPDREGRGTTLTLSKESTFQAQHTTTYRKLTIHLDDDPYHTVKSAKAEVLLNKTPGTHEYAIDRRDIGGLPVPVHSTRRQRYSSGTGWSTEMDDETEFDINPEVDLPEGEFTLSAYGLPEPVGVTWQKPTARYIWFLLAAAVFAALAVGFRYMARRRAQKLGI